MGYSHVGRHDDILYRLNRTTEPEKMDDMGRQTSQALSYLHDQCIAHRDFKPANILIVDRGSRFFCKVADFGESSKESTLRTFSGTSRYQSPEIFNPPYSNAADMWSLGTVLAEYWYALCLGKVDSPRDSSLPPTQREDVVDTFRSDRLELIIRQSDSIRRHLQKEAIERNCPMAPIVLELLKLDSRTGKHYIPAKTAVVRLLPDSGEINTTDLVKTTSRHTWRQD